MGWWNYSCRLKLRSNVHFDRLGIIPWDSVLLVLGLSSFEPSSHNIILKIVEFQMEEVIVSSFVGVSSFIVLKCKLTFKWFCPIVNAHVPLKLRFCEQDTNILRNHHLKFVQCINIQIYGGYFAKFSGLIKIHEL